VFRSNSQDGHSPSRFKASAVAKGNILIFVDTTAVVNHGWIQPLIAKLLDRPNLVAVPHYDEWTANDRLVCASATFSHSFIYFLGSQKRVAVRSLLVCLSVQYSDGSKKWPCSPLRELCTRPCGSVGL